MTLYQSGSTMQTTKFQNEALIYHTKLNFLKHFYILLLQLFLYTWNVLEELKNLPGFFLRVCSHENSFPVIFPSSRLTGEKNITSSRSYTKYLPVWMRFTLFGCETGKFFRKQIFKKGWQKKNDSLLLYLDI